jgi:cell division initiation protein
MAITVKDIQEKEFSIQAAEGYNPEQVDDFLDALADQLGAMNREMAALNNRIKELEAALAAAESKTPDYDETGYFKNLESAMRESLIGAQRIADETVSEAKRTAEKTVADANAQAEKTVADANAQAETLVASAQNTAAEIKADYEQLRAMADTYRENFKKIVEEQLAVLTAKETLLK